MEGGPTPTPQWIEKSKNPNQDLITDISRIICGLLFKKHTSILNLAIKLSKPIQVWTNPPCLEWTSSPSYLCLCPSSCLGNLRTHHCSLIFWETNVTFDTTQCKSLLTPNEKHVGSKTKSGYNEQVRKTHKNKNQGTRRTTSIWEECFDGFWLLFHCEWVRFQQLCCMLLA